jgi:hypothetical protein
VLLHDDGHRPGLYDLRVGDVDAPAVAIECVGAVDRIRTETWNIGPAQGPISLNLARDWQSGGMSGGRTDWSSPITWSVWLPMLVFELSFAGWLLSGRAATATDPAV